MGRRVRFAWCVVLAAGCALDAKSDLDAPQDAVDGGKADGPTQTCGGKVRCGNAEAPNILFPGNPACPNGCERNLAAEDLYIPPRNGSPWGDTYELGTAEPTTLSGYSSGRIALLRRLALVDDGEHAVLLDPSWDDGARDFTGDGPEYGDDIVTSWLLGDPSRTFLLIYSTRSVGWARYAALHDSDLVGDQVRVCSVDQPHLLVPTVPHVHDALVDPDAWDNGRCR